MQAMSKKSIRGVLLCVMCILFPRVTALAEPPDTNAASRIQETRIGACPPLARGPSVSSPLVSPDGRHMAYTTVNGEGFALVWDGKVIGQRYRRPLVSMTMSPDGKRIAFASMKEDGWHVVVDGEVSPRYQRVLDGSLTFSPNSEHFAYVAQANDRPVLLVDGKPYDAGEWDEIHRHLQFSADGSRLAFVARKGTKWHMVLDGAASPPHDKVLDAEFSPNGQRFAYWCDEDGKCIIVVDGQPSQPYFIGAEIVFSPDSKHLAYVATLGKAEIGRQHVFLDGQKGDEFTGVVQTSIVFSPDSKRLGYVAQDLLADDGLMFAVVDDERSQGWDNVSRLRFSGDSSSYAYCAEKNDQWHVVVDDRVGPGYHGLTIGSPIVSEKGAVVAYVASNGKKRCAVINGRNGPWYDVVKTPVLSPQGNHFAYVAATGQDVFLVQDGEPTSVGFLPIPESLRYSPDGRHFAMVLCAGPADRDFYVSLDGERGPRFDQIIDVSLTFGDGEGTLEYLAIRGEEMFRVRHAPQTH